MSIFIVSLLGILAVLPLVSLLFEKFRDSVIAKLRLHMPSLELSSSLDKHLLSEARLIKTPG